MRFKAKDFKYPDRPTNESIWIREAVETANKILDSYLATLPVVYGSNGEYYESQVSCLSSDLVSGKLWDVKPIEKKECKNHRPLSSTVIGVVDLSGECGECGIKLKATWSPA